MIILQKDVYQNVANENNLELELVASVGNTIFQSLRQSLNTPTHLAYELPKIGTFSVRFSRFERDFNNFVRAVSEEHNPKVIKRYEDDPELFNINAQIIEKIAEYREKHKDAKKRRYETE